jgi:hypothetical protein
MYEVLSDIVVLLIPKLCGAGDCELLHSTGFGRFLAEIASGFCAV